MCYYWFAKGMVSNKGIKTTFIFADQTKVAGKTHLPQYISDNMADFRSVELSGFNCPICQLFLPLLLVCLL